MKKGSDCSSGTSSSDSSSSSGNRRRPLEHQLSAVSTASDRDVVTIIQEDDQELAEAKIRERQAHQELPQERVPSRNRPDRNAPLQTSGRDVVTILREDDQDLAAAKARAYGASTDGSESSPTGPKKRNRNKPEPHDAASTDSHPHDIPSNDDLAANSVGGGSDATHSDHKLNFLGPKRDSLEKQKAKDRQYTNRSQAMAVNMALRTSQQDDQSSMDDMIQEEEEEEEEKVEEGVLLQASEHNFETRGSFQTEPLLTENSNSDRQQESQPGAFRVGTSFSPHQDDSSSSADITWEEDEQQNLSDESHHENDNDNLEESETEDEEEEEDQLPQSTDQTSGSSQEGDILVEATLVSPEVEDLEEEGQQETVIVPEPELVTAERMSETFTAQEMIKTRNGRRWVIATAILVVVVIVTSIVIGVGVVGRNKEPQITAAPTMAPTIFFDDVLPEATQAAIKEGETPQAKAYYWFLTDQESLRNQTDFHGPDHPQALTFVPIERFALATLYYATGGDDWIFSTNWLDHDESACDWYDTFYGSICSGGFQTRRQRHLLRRELQTTAPIPTKQYYNRLSLNKNNLTGSFPPEIALLSNLDVFNIHMNSIEGSIPTEFGTYQHMTLFQVYQNKLAGPIPSEFGMLPKLRQLNLAFNELTGSVPSQLGQLGSSLWTLSASNNPLEGTLPTQLGLLTSLQGMYFYKNPNITGPIPSELGELTAMTELQLNAAYFSGSLPAEIGALTLLRLLNLNDNANLQGTIPESWGNLTNLAQLRLHNTNLTGAIPDGLCNLVLAGTLQGLSVDCGKVNCTCDCDCSKSNDPSADELVTDSPIVEISMDMNETTIEMIEDPSSQFDNPDEEVDSVEGEGIPGELITTDPIDWATYDPLPPPECNTTHNETNSTADNDCWEYTDDFYYGYPPCDEDPLGCDEWGDPHGPWPCEEEEDPEKCDSYYEDSHGGGQPGDGYGPPGEVGDNGPAGEYPPDVDQPEPETVHAEVGQPDEPSGGSGSEPDPPLPEQAGDEGPEADTPQHEQAGGDFTEAGPAVATPEEAEYSEWTYPPEFIDESVQGRSSSNIFNHE